MTARQPRRARRRAAPTSNLPRPSSAATEEATQVPAALTPAAARAAARRTAVHHREHHVTRDYSHVHRDMVTVAVVGVVVVAFIVGMSFVI